MHALVLALLVVLPRIAGAATFLAEIQSGFIWQLPPVVTPDGLFAYSESASFQRAPDGTLTQIQTFDAGVGSPDDLVLGSADGGFVYVTGSPGVSVLKRDPMTGLVTMVEIEGGSPIFPFRDPRFIAVSPDGKNLYATTSGSLLTYARDPVTGELSFLNEIQDGNDPGEIDDIGGATAIVVSPDDAHVYVAGDRLFAFERTAPDGALSLIAAYDTLTDFFSAVLSADGTELYAGTGQEGIAHYVRNPATGELSFAGSEPAVVREGLEKFMNHVESLGITADGTRLVGLVQSYVVAFDRDPGTGALELLTIERESTKDVSLSADGAAVYAGAKFGHVYAFTTFGCTPAPAAGCRPPVASRKSVLSIKDSDPSRDKLTWRSTPAGVTDVADFGDPIAGDDHVLFCLYDASASPQPLLDAVAPARGTCDFEPCWSVSSSGTSLKYVDDTGLPSGIQKLQARERAVDRGAVKVKAKSRGLALPSLPLTPPVRAQLQSRTGACWDSVYSLPKKNDASRFTAKSD